MKNSIMPNCLLAESQAGSFCGVFTYYSAAIKPGARDGMMLTFTGVVLQVDVANKAKCGAKFDRAHVDFDSQIIYFESDTSQDDSSQFTLTLDLDLDSDAE